MGKGFGTNSKAEAGRERKAAHKELKKLEQQRKKEEEETREWEKGAKTKSTKQVIEEAKRAEKLQKKQEKERLEALEAAELEKYRPPHRHTTDRGGKADLGQAQKPPSREGPFVASLHEEARAVGEETLRPTYSASNIDDALFLLEASSSSASSSQKVERHPERRVKAAFAAYEAREMPRLKAEFPHLRLSQLKQKLFEGWQKAPENPFNQAHISYNATKSQEALRTQGEIESRLRQMQLPPS